MTDSNLSAFKLIFKVLSVAPRIYEKLKEWKGKPSKDDRERLDQYCRRFDERRVFRAPYHEEDLMACIVSLSQVKEFTDQTLSEIKHPVARAVLGAILDEIRRFLDKWERKRSHWRGPISMREDYSFFQDLGELRGNMKIFVGMLTELIEVA